jgi:polyisoprenyl-phosphate glycosyltransferase
MTIQKKTIGVVTPCYNEQESVEECYLSVKAVFEGPLDDYDYQHLFCDNCSTDTTVEKLREIAKHDSNVKVIVNSRNFGALQNIYNGMLVVKGDAVIPMLAADLQDPPEVIVTFVKHWENEYKVVYGVREDRGESQVMRGLRNLFYLLSDRWSPFQLPPNTGEFQLIDRNVVEEIRKFDDYFPFVRGMIAYCGFPKVAVPYTWKKRRKGKSKSSLSNLLSQGLNGIISFSAFPMRLILLSGISLATISVITAVMLFVINIFYFRQLAPPGIALLTVALFFFAGVQIFLIGFVGEYVLAIHSQVRRRPIVIEKERINFLDDKLDNL